MVQSLRRHEGIIALSRKLGLDDNTLLFGSQTGTMGFSHSYVV